MNFRKMLKNWAFLSLVAGVIWTGSVRAVAAGPHFTLTPASKSVTNGSTFQVTIGADSGTDTVVAMDVVGTFDATKLEIVSIEKASSPAFDFAYDANTPLIYNETGKFEITLSPLSSSIYDGKVVSGALLVVNFKAKSTGTASVNLTCTAGAVTESNIINQESMDVADCAANQSGSYTITASGGDTTTTTGTTPIATPTGGELPQTGGITSTLGLIIFGIASLAGALFLRVL